MEPSSIPSAFILNIGCDPTILSSRGLVLRSAGFSVVSASSLKKGIGFFRWGYFDAIILCHSLQESDRLSFIRVIRAIGSSVPVNTVYSSDFTAPASLPDSSTGNAPVAFLAHVSEVLQKDRTAHDR